MTGTLFTSNGNSRSIHTIHTIRSTNDSTIILKLSPTVTRGVGRVTPRAHHSVHRTTHTTRRHDRVLTSTSLTTLINATTNTLTFSGARSTTGPFITSPTAAAARVGHVDSIATTSHSRTHASLDSSSIATRSAGRNN